MPEHVHLLLSEPSIQPLAKALQALKLSVSKQADTKPFWQPRYYDFNVFTTRKLLEKLNYMHQTPSPAAWSKLLKTGPTPAISTTSPALPTPPST